MEKGKFSYYKELYQDNKFDVLLQDTSSVYWLKFRSISRKELMVKFCELNGIDCKDIKASSLFEYIYNKQIPETKIDDFIELVFKEEHNERKENEQKLVSELYKMQVLDWGGIYQNNLEKTIIDNYVKKIKDYEVLNKKIENEIHSSMRGYVQSSWYNHWTSIIIEDIFKVHKKVIPTVGLIKKVDFFIDNVPFDLKVTYFPEGYMTARRKSLNLPTEIQSLKRFAKSIGIQYENGQKDKSLYSELITRFKESTNPLAKEFIAKFNKERWDIIKSSMADCKHLIQWLYEEQGERRFDAANRLFLVLIDKNSLEESWKMKRNTELLKDSINGYLDKFDSKNSSELCISFDWIDGKRYATTADIIFIVKE